MQIMAMNFTFWRLASIPSQPRWQQAATPFALSSTIASTPK